MTSKANCTGMHIGNFPCPNCNSEDNMSVYLHEDGTKSATCWSPDCKDFHPTNEELKGIESNANFKKVERVYITDEQVQELESRTTFDSRGYRGISSETCKTFGVRTEFDDRGNVRARYYPTTIDDELVGYRTRLHPKSFTRPIGYAKIDCQLFGQSKFKKHQKRVLIVGGEEDQLAASEMLRDYQKSKGQQEYDLIPVVSPICGEGSSKKQVQKQYEWINSHDMIIVGLDNDKAGKKATEDMIKVLPQTKVYIAEWPSKDANACLQEGKQKRFITSFFNAKKHSPAGVLGSNELMAHLLERATISKIPLPPFMRKAQKMLCGGLPLGYIVNILAASGIGKCHGKGTKIIMHDSSVKNVEDIVSGDLLMGDDGSPRTVMSTTSGLDNLYEVSQKDGDSYVVNSDHILSLKVSSAKPFKGHNKGDVINISIKDYLELPNYKKVALKGYKADCTKLGENAKPVEDPYGLGLWLADEAIDASDKHVPGTYKTSSYEERLDLLAGILDGNGHKIPNGFEIAVKSDRLSNDIVFLARSVGLRVSTRNNSEEELCNRLFISGNTAKIPNRLSSKKCAERLQQEDALVCGIDVKCIGEGDYYGFTLDGNHLYCLQDFTVTHNTTYINEIVYDMIFNSPYMVGVVSLEATSGEYYEYLLSRHLGRKIARFHTPEEKLEFLVSPFVVEQERILRERENGDPRFYLVDDRGDVESLKDKIEYLIVGCNCKVIVIDVLSDIFDELKTEEQAGFMRDMKRMVAQYNVTFVNINHARKNGNGGKANSRGAELSEEDMQGSSSIFKSGGINFILSRDKMAECPVEKNTTKVVITKARGAGETGSAGEIYYDNETHTLTEMTEELKARLQREQGMTDPTNVEKSVEAFSPQDLPFEL